jgi:hypothetical protein
MGGIGQDGVVRTLGRLAWSALLVVLVTAGPVGAHSEDGEMTVLAAEPSGSGAVQLEVGIVYASDGHLAEEAVVTATLEGPAGVVVGPVDLPRIAGARYGAEVAVPVEGTWQVTFNSTGPAAQGSAVVDVVAASTTGPSSSHVRTTDGSVVSSGASADADPTGPDGLAGSERAVEDGDGGSPGLAAVAVAVIAGTAALVGAIAVAAVRRRRGAG